jgi:hypothetical protein
MVHRLHSQTGMTDGFLYGPLPDPPVAASSTIVSIDGWILALLALPLAVLLGVTARNAIRWVRRRWAVRRPVSVTPLATGRP